ncbi:sialin-like isoform X1 [Penaeus chinensis]|uniref:sialin-like isoform X1 n=1 Tax=Penaeus chinensis TaxID=139456 RepID=UPI001FB6AC8E|nr:sialin-like isoform X1 [Penaeus chinensis]
MSLVKKWTAMMPTRVVLAMMTSLGVVMIYMVRINLSMGIIAMVQTVSASDEAAHHTRTVPYCLQRRQTDDNTNDNVSFSTAAETLSNYNIGDSTELPDAAEYSYEYNLTMEELGDKMFLTSGQRGAVLAAFFYGYFLTGVLGGRLAELYGTKLVLGGSVFLSSILTLLTPIAARTHYGALIALRAVMGLGQGVSYPSMHAMIARWVPPLEKPRFTAFVFLSSCLGIIVTMPMCGLIIDSLGWPYIFYVSGTLSLLWLGIWARFMYETPADHPRISKEERDYILEGIKEGTAGKKPSRVPWKQMGGSLSFWAIIVCHVGNMFGWTLLATQLPTFMSSVLGFSIKSNGALSSLPFLARYLGGNGLSWLGDWILTRGWLSLLATRRVFTLVGLCIPALMLAAVGYVGCNSTAALALLCVGTFFNGAQVPGYVSNMQDIAPNLAGTLLGASTTAAHMLSMLSPMVVGVLTPDQSPEQWQSAFWVAAAVYVSTAVFFCLCCSAELQQWNFGDSEDVEAEVPQEESKVLLQEKEKGQVATEADENSAKKSAT